MTPRSRKPVMLAIFGNSDPKSYQNNISELLEESEGESEAMTPTSSGEIPLSNLQVNNLRSKSENDISSANDNGLPVVETVGSNSSSTPESLTSAFRDYIYSRQGMVCDPSQDDDSFSSQPDDFESSNEYQKLESSNSSSSLDKTQEIEKIINQSCMSESLLYCLDGNNVSPSPSKSRKRHLESSDSSSESLKRPLIENDLTDL